jgi:hypothetical protein
MSRVAGGHSRRKREAPLMRGSTSQFRGNSRHLSPAATLCTFQSLRRRLGPERQAIPSSLPDTARAGRATSRRKRAAHDSIVSLVLAIHAEADRPLGFDQVVDLSGNRVTREQVSTASSALCRDGQLDRIRSGVYQWSQGQRAAARRIPAARRPAELLPQHTLMPAEPTGLPAREPVSLPLAELFSRLFPDGVQVTGELFADLEQLLRLTSKLTAGGNATAR